MSTLSVLVLVVAACGVVFLTVLARGKRRVTALVAEASGHIIRAHEKSEAILERVGDGVVVTDEDGKVSEWNSASERLFGRSAAQAVGRNCPALLGLETKAGTPALPLAARVITKDPEGMRVFRTLPDKSKQALLMKVAFLESPGQRTEIILSFRDITRLHEADEAKTTFLATLSHELKTPLTVIQGFAQTLLANTALPEAVRTSGLEAIQRRSAELSRIVDRLLLSSSIDAGKLDLEVEPVEAVAIVGEHVEAWAASSKRDISLFSDRATMYGLGQAGALGTVINHLLDNAVKYSPDGGLIIVSISDDDQGLSISVSDQGIGMTAAQQEACFQRFWQADSSNGRVFGGSGIGLYVVRGLVRAMGGDIKVKSSTEEGSTFTVLLRRLRSPAASAPPKEMSGESSMIREFMHQIGVPASPRI